MNFPSEYKKYKELSMPDLAEIMAGHEELQSKANIARLVYEEKQTEQRFEAEKNHMKVQHVLDKDNIELQHKLNEEIVKKQLKLMKVSTIITSLSTVTAALAGAYLAYALTQIQRPPQIKTSSPKISQSHNVQKKSASHHKETNVSTVKKRGNAQPNAAH